VGQRGGGHNASGFASVLGPLGDGGQTVGRILASSAVIVLHGCTYSNVDDVGFRTAQVSGGRAGGVRHLGIGAVGLQR